MYKIFGERYKGERNEKYISICNDYEVEINKISSNIATNRQILDSINLQLSKISDVSLNNCDGLNTPPMCAPHFLMLSRILESVNSLPVKKTCIIVLAKSFILSGTGLIYG